MSNLTFGQAIEAAKEGKLISRAGWNGKGMYVFQRPADEILISAVVKIKSLPEAVKETFRNKTFDEGVTVKFTAYLCMKAADGSIVNGWLASQTDMLANDWGIIEY